MRNRYVDEPWTVIIIMMQKYTWLIKNKTLMFHDSCGVNVVLQSGIKSGTGGRHCHSDVDIGRLTDVPSSSTRGMNSSSVVVMGATCPAPSSLPAPLPSLPAPSWRWLANNNSCLWRTLWKALGSFTKETTATWKFTNGGQRPHCSWVITTYAPRTGQLSSHIRPATRLLQWLVFVALY